VKVSPTGRAEWLRFGSFCFQAYSLIAIAVYGIIFVDVLPPPSVSSPISTSFFVSFVALVMIALDQFKSRDRRGGIQSLAFAVLAVGLGWLTFPIYVR
jgi:hypothetical protein